MDKLYGYKESELKDFIEFFSNQPKGKALSRIFEEFAAIKNKSKGTVRNMYYALAKKAEADERFSRSFLGGRKITVSKIVEFKKEEERTLIKTILLGQMHGRSIRSVINELSGNDSKKALRYQNKYRNVYANKPQLIEEISKEIALESGESFYPFTRSDYKTRVSGGQLKKLSDEINSLIDRIAGETRAENILLKSRLARIEEENSRLKNLLYGSANKAELFFKKEEGNKRIN